MPDVIHMAYIVQNDNSVKLQLNHTCIVQMKYTMEYY